MAIDGIFLHLLLRELEPLCGDARVDRIHQPARESLLIALRSRAGQKRLLLSASPQTPRIQLTESSYENPGVPPMFCMLLRKHLQGARLMQFSQVARDRIVRIGFEGRNDFGDITHPELVVEIMGRHSNIILTDGEGRILDAIKRIDPTMSSVRQVLPNLPYELPPMQEKLDLLSDGAEAVSARMESLSGQPVAKAAMAAVMGISPVVAGEIAAYVSRGGPGTMETLGKEERGRLRFFLRELRGKIESGGRPTMVLTREGAPKDLTFIEVNQYGQQLASRSYPSYSALLDAFYSQKDLSERMKQRSGDLFRLLSNLSERTERKLQHQREELLQSQDRDRLRIQGDLLNANLYRLQKGETMARLENFYEPDSPILEIPLDVRLTPAQNAQRYYAEYRKADTAERMLRRLIEEGEADFAYLDTVMDNLLRATSEAELDAIREELVKGGYLRRRAGKEKKAHRLEPDRYRSSDGFLILRGRSNLQNDQLTMREARKNDLWFHTQNIPGSHVIIVTGGERVPNRTLEEAAILAAYHSKAQGSALVPVDYTEIRNVRKPSGAKPGFVLYVNYQTAVVTPREELVRSLAEKGGAK
ncbi:MAG: fibronectin/fibrinogen-binding protein [Provencibacterium sp.]|nr:fibronectin/fibrinogen-binding protein [Provencibacterium sp.]